MKNFAAFLALSLVVVSPLVAQDSVFRPMEIIASYSRPTIPHRSEPSSHIKGIQAIADRFGIAYTEDSIFLTRDGGGSWTRGGLSVAPFETIGGAVFADVNSGYAIISDRRDGKLILDRTADGGATWERQPIELAGIGDHEAALDDAKLTVEADGRLSVIFPVTTSSNFSGHVKFSSGDGRDWIFVEKIIEIRSSDEPAAERSGSWTISVDGNCGGFKTGCVQEKRIMNGGVDITPSELIELARIAREKARAESTPMFAAPPGGSTRVSLGRGFDKCTAAPASQMQTWWDNSYFQDSNIYMSGRNRGCSQPQLTATWVDQVSAMGWGLIPTIVGYQSPCSVCTTCQKHSSDTATAETQGRGEADIAIADANNLGLTAGTVLYYDMERYDETAQTPNCRISTTAFLKGWTDRLHELGYVSGTYGSPTNAVADWIGIPGTSRMDAVWLARWDNVMSVWQYNSPSPVVPTNVWNNHQRIKQWQAPHNETWGGVTFNIDGNILDGPVAGPTIAKNRQADFDGDRKTDISVFRPDTGVWYVQKSNATGYIILQFGIATDIPTPGDFDGDGRTDQAVFRPSDGTWHMLTKGNFYTARAFGTAGDIPAAADYNGDGRTDLAVFRPSTGVWYIANSDSLGTITIQQFGLDGDKPVIGDYDGDGRSDIAVWRPSNGAWYVSRSSDNGFTAVSFGISTDRPAQGDFDGDAKTDFAVLRDGTWYLLQTTNGFAQFNFGVAGDLPTTGDYDGDGKDDAAVFRPSSGVWYLLQSQAGFFAAQFGIAGDKPIPNAYLPQ